MTSLETLQLEFKTHQSYPDLKSGQSFPPTRSVLPTLTSFRFIGTNEYLEGFVARVDAPKLSQFITKSFKFKFNDIDFKDPELIQFIVRTPTLGVYDEARFVFHGHGVRVTLHQSHPEPSDERMVEVEIILDRHHLSTLAQICTSLRLRPLLTVEKLYIDGFDTSRLLWEDTVNTEWLDLLLPFTAVQNLYVSKRFSPPIALALAHTGGRTTEVLPSLQNIHLQGFYWRTSESVQKSIAQFISARQITNHPFAISASGWYRDYCWEVDHW
jgi:hypothetical protein